MNITEQEVKEIVSPLSWLEFFKIRDRSIELQSSGFIYTIYKEKLTVLGKVGAELEEYVIVDFIHDPAWSYIFRDAVTQLLRLPFFGADSTDNQESVILSDAADIDVLKMQSDIERLNAELDRFKRWNGDYKEELERQRKRLEMYIGWFETSYAENTRLRQSLSEAQQ